MSAPDELPPESPSGWRVLAARIFVIALVGVVTAFGCFVGAGYWHSAVSHSLRGYRIAGAVLGCVCVAVSVWFYCYQKDVKGRQISLRSLLMLVLAIAVGLQVGLLLVAPAIQ